MSDGTLVEVIGCWGEPHIQSTTREVLWYSAVGHGRKAGQWRYRGGCRITEALPIDFRGLANNSAAAVVNAIFIFVTFLLSLPALFLPTNRGWLRAQGWLVVFCATFTLGLGLAIWVETLQTRAALENVWARETPLIQSLLQQKVWSSYLGREHGASHGRLMGHGLNFKDDAIAMD